VAAAHVFVSDLETLVLRPEDRHHLSRVLRLRPGEAVSAADDRGSWRACRFRDGPALDPDGQIELRTPLEPTLTVGFALTKGERVEWTVQKLTELGVDRIIPMVSERTVVRWDPHKVARNLDRLRAIARQAAMQSRQSRIPTVETVALFAQMVDGSPSGVALAEREGGPPSLEHPTVLVGPEGGWSETELASGLPRVGIGPSVLRAETAAIAVASVLAGLRVGLVRPVEPVG
jgi:16S rRNA (uracil1498-N3)-methyltransferase